MPSGVTTTTRSPSLVTVAGTARLLGVVLVRVPGLVGHGPILPHPPDPPAVSAEVVGEAATWVLTAGRGRCGTASGQRRDSAAVPPLRRWASHTGRIETRTSTTATTLNDRRLVGSEEVVVDPDRQRRCAGDRRERRDDDLVEGQGEGEHHPGDERGAEQREGDPPEGGPRPGPEVRRRRLEWRPGRRCRVATCPWPSWPRPEPTPGAAPGPPASEAGAQVAAPASRVPSRPVRGPSPSHHNRSGARVKVPGWGGKVGTGQVVRRVIWGALPDAGPRDRPRDQRDEQPDDEQREPRDDEDRRPRRGDAARAPAVARQRSRDRDAGHQPDRDAEHAPDRGEEERRLPRPSVAGCHGSPRGRPGSPGRSAARPA